VVALKHTQANYRALVSKVSKIGLERLGLGLGPEIKGLGLISSRSLATTSRLYPWQKLGDRGVMSERINRVSELRYLIGGRCAVWESYGPAKKHGTEIEGLRVGRPNKLGCK